MSRLPQVVDAAGRPVPLDRELGRGGEGAVYTVISDPASLAKVYLDGKAPPADKLTALVTASNPALLRTTAWPQAVLYHPGPARRPAGFVMNRLTDCRPIQELANPKERLRAFPRAGWGFQVRAAANLAAAVDEVHTAGCVIGDVNESNALVSPQHRVWLIDCDSFQVRAGGRDHLCGVAKEFYLPPELFDRDLSKTVRTPNHDRYGLAVLVYQLLFVGRHPYVGLHDDDDDHTQLIRKYRFAQGPNAHRWGMRPPPHCPTFDDIPPDLRTLFCRAFERGGETGTRPTALDWFQALGRLAAAIRTCSADDGHQHWSGAAGCAWCRIERNGPQFYIGAGQDTAGYLVDEVRLQQVIQRLEAVARLDFPFDRRAFAPLLPPAGRALPAAVADAYDRWRAARDHSERVLRERRVAEVAELRRAEELSRTRADALMAEQRRLLGELDKRIRDRETELSGVNQRGADHNQKLAAAYRRVEDRIARDYRDEMALADAARTERRALTGALVGLVVVLVLSVAVGLPGWVYLMIGLGVGAMAFIWVVVHVAQSPTAEMRRRVVEYRRIRDEAWNDHADRVRAARREYEAERSPVVLALDDLHRQRAELGRATTPEQVRAVVLGRARAAAAEATAEVARQQQAVVRAAEREYHHQLEATRSDRRQRADAAERRVAELARQWADRVGCYRDEHRRLSAAVRSGEKAVRRTHPAYQQEEARLTATAEAIARTRHMRQELICDAGIEQIGPRRVAALDAHGITTAADISEQRVRAIDGFGEKLTANLLAWKESVARAFRFDPKTGLAADRRLMVARYQAQQKQRFDEMERNLSDLLSLAGGCRADLDRLRPAVVVAVADHEQCQADLAAVTAATAAPR